MVNNCILNDFKVSSIGVLCEYRIAFLIWALSFCIFSFLPEAKPFWMFIGAVFSYGVFLALSVLLLVASISVKVSEKVQLLLLLFGIGISYLASKYGLLFPFIKVIKCPALLFTSASIAILLVRRVEKSWHIAVAGFVGLMADMWSVFSTSGLTRHLVEEAPEVLNYLLLGFPFPGGTIRPMIGAADYVFLAIFVLHCHKFKLGTFVNLQILSFSLVLTVLMANIFGVGLPAIPLMALFFICTNRKRLWGDFVADYKRGFSS
jgi:hypothetical protein